MAKNLNDFNSTPSGFKTAQEPNFLRNGQLATGFNFCGVESWGLHFAPLYIFPNPE
jgi:hypothetical protein